MKRIYTKIFSKYTLKTNKQIMEKEKQILDPIIFIDLITAGLQSGSSIIKILKTLDTISNIPNFTKIINKVLLGITWKESYSNTFIKTNNHYKEIFETIENSWIKGTSPINNLQKLKNRIQTFEEKNLQENISKLSTKITLPLGLCYLPSFICLGLLPIIISSGGNINL